MHGRRNRQKYYNLFLREKTPAEPKKSSNLALLLINQSINRPGLQGHHITKGVNAKQSGKKIQGARQNSTMATAEHRYQRPALRLHQVAN